MFVFECTVYFPFTVSLSISLFLGMPSAHTQKKFSPSIFIRFASNVDAAIVRVIYTNAQTKNVFS